MNALVTTFKELPRSARWAVVAAACLLGYFVVVEPLVTLTVKVGDRADAKAKMLADWDKTSAKQKEAAGVVATGLLNYGEVRLPDEPKARGEALNAKIDKVMRAHGVIDYTRRERPGPLPAKRAQALAASVEGTGRVARLVRELDFTCTPESLSLIIADLEKAQEISAVSAVHIRKDKQNGTRNSSSSAKLLSVSVTAEAWVLQRESAS